MNDSGNYSPTLANFRRSYNEDFATHHASFHKTKNVDMIFPANRSFKTNSSASIVDSACSGEFLSSTRHARSMASRFGGQDARPCKFVNRSHSSDRIPRNQNYACSVEDYAQNWSRSCCNIHCCTKQYYPDPFSQHAEKPARVSPDISEPRDWAKDYPTDMQQCLSKFPKLLVSRREPQHSRRRPVNVHGDHIRRSASNLHGSQKHIFPCILCNETNKSSYINGYFTENVNEGRRLERRPNSPHSQTVDSTSTGRDHMTIDELARSVTTLRFEIERLTRQQKTLLDGQNSQSDPNSTMSDYSVVENTSSGDSEKCIETPESIRTMKTSISPTPSTDGIKELPLLNEFFIYTKSSVQNRLPQGHHPVTRSFDVATSCSASTPFDVHPVKEFGSPVTTDVELKKEPKIAEALFITFDTQEPRRQQLARKQMEARTSARRVCSIDRSPSTTNASNANDASLDKSDVISEPHPTLLVPGETASSADTEGATDCTIKHPPRISRLNTPRNSSTAFHSHVEGTSNVKQHIGGPERTDVRYQSLPRKAMKSSSFALQLANRNLSSSHDFSLPSTDKAQTRLFVKPKSKSNRQVIVNSINYCCLAGAVNEAARKNALQDLAAADGSHFIILFRNARFQYRGLYLFDAESEGLQNITGSGPRKINNNMVAHYYKYNSGAKQFTEITATKNLSTVVDAIVLQESHWPRSASSRRNEASSRKPPAIREKSARLSQG